ncbi:ABC transporter ATP-binding protein, partial [Chloroflexota bacterium]
ANKYHIESNSAQEGIMSLLEAKDLNKEYDDRSVLKEVTIAVNPGEAFALIGPTGSGKTTLIRLLDLLQVPTSGRIYFDGVEVTHGQRERLEARRRMSHVQQKPAVFTMNVYDNVACGLKWRHEKSDITRLKVEKALELVGMNDYRDRNAKTLSGGETQCLAIARALVTEPEILFLDEPTANLDPLTTSRVEQVIDSIIKERKTAVVMATHDMAQGQRLASSIGVLIGGEVLQVGNPNQIFTAPTSLEVAELVGVDNILGGVVATKDNSLVTMEVNDHTIQAISHFNVGEKIYALIRPEDITLTLSKDISSARNNFKGKVTKMTLVGPLFRVEIGCGFPLLVLITKKSAEEMGISIGKDVYASFKATAIQVIKRWH